MGETSPGSPVRREQRGRPRFKVEGALVALGKPGMLTSLGLGLKKHVLVNLSQGGALVMGRLRVEPGTKLRCRLEIPKWKDLIEGDVEVRWCAQSARNDAEFYLGVRFLALTVADAQRIEKMHELTKSVEYRAKAAARKEASSPKLPKAGV
jgi:hypothetical protein